MANPYNALVVSSSTTQAKRLSASSLRCQSITFFGVNSFSSAFGTANTGNVYVGFDPARLPIRIPAGRSVTLAANDGQFLDVGEMWMIPATANDGVAYLASP